MATPPVIPKPNILKRGAIKLAEKIANRKTKKTQEKLANMSNEELAEETNKITYKVAQNKTKKNKFGLSSNTSNKRKNIQKEKSKSFSPPLFQEKQNNIEEESNNGDNIRPLGSPGLYGMLVLGLFGFASYLQFFAFKDIQTFKDLQTFKDKK